MKPFYFNEQEYTDLVELGNAFINNYEGALMAVQTKDFVSFAKSINKEYKTIIFDALYESKTLQSVLSIIIYAFTNTLIIISLKIN